MWELVEANRTNVEYWLKEGYEPFAVSVGANNFITFWLKREVEDDKGQGREKNSKSKVGTRKSRTSERV